VFQTLHLNMHTQQVAVCILQKRHMQPLARDCVHAAQPCASSWIHSVAQNPDCRVGWLRGVGGGQGYTYRREILSVTVTVTLFGAKPGLPFEEPARLTLQSPAFSAIQLDYISPTQDSVLCTTSHRILYSCHRTVLYRQAACSFARD